LDTQQKKDLVQLRKKLHQYPETAFTENKTAGILIEYLGRFEPSVIMEGIAGNGILVVFDSGKEGLHTVFRAELDALPIEEKNQLEYQSQIAGNGHMCGHDGHMTMVASLAQFLHSTPIIKGKVALLFQPAEETGEGAEKVISDRSFLEFKPDYIFGLHNIPGKREGLILERRGTFCAGSVGLVINLMGITSHAAHPENGINPGLAVAEFIQEASKLSNNPEHFEDFTISTLIYTKIGEPAFGTSAGEAEIGFTLRAYKRVDLLKLKEMMTQLAANIAQKHELEIGFNWVESFPVTTNKDEAQDIFYEALEKSGLEHETLDEPFRWSEDFGHYRKVAKSYFWGLGSGENQPQLHNPDFDFPDELIPIGFKIYSSIIEVLNR